MDPQTPEPPPEIPAQAFAALLAGIAQITEVTNAYRAAQLQNGYSETAAEAMAVDFHALLMRSIQA